jgi:methyl-accepting chemotaxis protein
MEKMMQLGVLTAQVDMYQLEVDQHKEMMSNMKTAVGPHATPELEDQFQSIQKTIDEMEDSIKTINTYVDQLSAEIEQERQEIYG